MNVERFLERWQAAGVTKQLAVLLACVVRRLENGEVALSMSEIDDVLAGGQTVVSRYDKDHIRLLFSGEYTTLYTIDDNVRERTPQWQTPQTSVVSSGLVKTDEELAEIEQNIRSQNELREAARALRTQPIYSGQPKKNSRHRRPTEEENLQ